MCYGPFQFHIVAWLVFRLFGMIRIMRIHLIEILLWRFKAFRKFCVNFVSLKFTSFTWSQVLNRISSMWQVWEKSLRRQFSSVIHTVQDRRSAFKYERDNINEIKYSIKLKITICVSEMCLRVCAVWGEGKRKSRRRGKRRGRVKRGRHLILN